VIASDIFDGVIIKRQAWVNRLLHTPVDELQAKCDSFNIPVLDSTMPAMAPGGFLIQGHLACIRDNFMYTFKKDEWVAWQQGVNESPRYGIVKEVITDNISVTDGKSVFMMRYKVEVGENFGNTLEFSVLSLFKFISPTTLHDANRNNNTSEQGTDEEEEEEEAAGVALLQQYLQDPYFDPATTTAERELYALRLHNATVENESFREHRATASTFITRQLQQVAQVSRARLPHLHPHNVNNVNDINENNNNNGNNSNNNIDNNNNNNNNNSNNEQEHYAAFEAHFLQNCDERRRLRQHFAEVSGNGFSAPSAQNTSRHLDQIRNDCDILGHVKAAAKGNMYDLLCFLSQQLVEKSLKAALTCEPHSSRIAKSHAIASLLAHCVPEVKDNQVIQRAANVVADYYITTRYFDGLPSPLVTHGAFSMDAAEEATALALEVANIVIRYVSRRLTAM